MSKSIAEIIGWEHQPLSDTWRRPGAYVGHVDGCDGQYCSCGWPGPNVDDMLAWVQAQNREVQIRGGSPHSYWQVRITRPGEFGVWVPFSRACHGKTLLEALEQAVRLVAGES